LDGNKFLRTWTWILPRRFWIRRKVTGSTVQQICVCLSLSLSLSLSMCIAELVRNNKKHEITHVISEK
jgi:hypothetical protein